MAMIAGNIQRGFVEIDYRIDEFKYQGRLATENHERSEKLVERMIADFEGRLEERDARQEERDDAAWTRKKDDVDALKVTTQS